MQTAESKHKLFFVFGSVHSGFVLQGFFLFLSIFVFTRAASGQAGAPGTLDASFIKGAGADGFVRVVTLQPDGKVLLGGNFSTVRGVTNPLISRLNLDGSADSGFVSPFPLPVLASRIYTVGLSTNGNMIVAGLFTNIGSTFRTNIARLNKDGSVDASFDSGAGPSGLVRILKVQPDGRILIGGEFTTVNSTNRNRIARLSADGSLDNSFNPGLGADDAVRTVALLANGQILVGGLFTSFDGHPLKYLVRLNSDGGLDTSFPAGPGPNNAVYFIAPQPEGTLLVGGDFTSLNGTNINRIARLHMDGSIDDSFSPIGGVLGGPVYHVLRQPNGKIVIGGGFNTVNGISLNHLARLTADGLLDPQFNIGTGASDMVLSLALQTDGRVLAGGLFATYNGSSVGMFARIYGDPAYPQIVVNSADSAQLTLAWPAWASAYALQQTESLNPENWQRITNTANLQNEQMILNLPLASASQFFRLISQ